MADVNQLLQKATRLYSKGKLSDASKIYQKVVRQAPKFVDAINMYGITLAQLGQLPAAADQFSTIIKLEPGKAAAYENLARVYMQMKQFAQAQTTCEQGLGFSPGSYNLHFGLAAARMSQLDYKHALESFSRAKAINATAPPLFINMGTALSQLGQSGEAINAFQQALRLDPNSAEAYLRLGQLYIRMNDFLQAEEALVKACQIQGDRYPVHLSLADAYVHNSKYDLALKHYFAADKLQPGSQDVYTKLDKLILHGGSKEKGSLLDNLAKEKVYDNWSEAVDDAKRLAQLLAYPDENALAVLRRFLNDYNPAILHSREWWQQELKQFGDARYGHDKILRGIHSAVFSWSLPDRQTLTSIAEFSRGTRLYSCGAGSALWERLLSDHFSIEVVATDFEPRHSYLPIIVEDYSKSTINEDDAIFLSWVIRGDAGVLNVLNNMKSGQKLVLVGEPRDEFGIPRICATPEMFDLLDKEFALSASIPLVSYSMLNDTVSLYIKN